MRLRRRYAKRIYRMLRGWLIFVAFVIIGTGSLERLQYFSLSDAVLATLIGGTSVTVVGLFAIVANYLFPKRATKP
jgi:hypothetical protein